MTATMYFSLLAAIYISPNLKSEARIAIAAICLVCSFASPFLGVKCADLACQCRERLHHD